MKVYFSLPSESRIGSSVPQSHRDQRSIHCLAYVQRCLEKGHENGAPMIGSVPLEGTPEHCLMLTPSLSLWQKDGLGFNCFSSPLQLGLCGNGPVRGSMKPMEETPQGLCHRNVWSWNPGSALTSCVTLKKSFTIPEPDLLHA